MVNYSIIIPHKNCPSLLKRCIDSIPERNDIQIIVVDDNSDIGKKPSFVRNGLEIILLDAQQAKGAGHARNVGIEKANGKWLMFADSDDMFTGYLYNFFDKYANDEMTDVVYLNADNVNEKGERWPYIINYYIDNYLKNRFYSEKVLRYAIWTPWTRMVKKELVSKNNITFEEIPTGNDMMFSLNCSKYASTIVVEKEVLYLYSVPQNRSLTETNRRKLSNISYRIELGQRQNQLYRSVGYLFKDSNITAYRNAPCGVDEKLYKKKYMEEWKKHSISFFSELSYTMINRIGLLMGIIK